MKVKTTFFISLFCLLFTNGIYACTCGKSSVKEAYNNAFAVVVAKVVKIKEREIDEKGYYVGNQSVNLKVKKSFKGDNFKNIIISQGNSLCDWSFNDDKLNKTYLFYLAKTDENNDQFRVISCSRSSLLKSASDDISWLSNLPYSLKRIRISGTANISDKDYVFPPLAGLKLKIIGENKVFNLITDKNGFYEIWDMPTGKYKIETEIPKDYSLRWIDIVSEYQNKYFSSDAPDESQLEFSVKPKDTIGIDLMFEEKKDEK